MVLFAGRRDAILRAVLDTIYKTASFVSNAITQRAALERTQETARQPQTKRAWRAMNPMEISSGLINASTGPQVL
jgi:hypothetical protein